jgi:FtsP/CotA-like multicopper oxidase with cupredoxin domain
MSTYPVTTKARVGDWIETRGLPGQASRRGQVVELLGAAGHEHYRVRWDERHESIVYPADGVIVIPRKKNARRKS